MAVLVIRSLTYPTQQVDRLQPIYIQRYEERAKSNSVQVVKLRVFAGISRVHV